MSKVVANSEQVLCQKYGRRLVTMEKCNDFDPSLKAIYLTVASESASRPFSQIREKMMGDLLVGGLDKREERKRKAAAASASEEEEGQGGGDQSTEQAEDNHKQKVKGKKTS
jgi:hypothetical protein